jgi:hypothetical protein
MHTNALNRRTCFFVLILVWSSACTNYVVVPSAEYTKLEESPRHGYRVRTHDNEEYLIRALSVRDSAMVISQLRASVSEPDSVPIVLSLEYVKSIERIEVNYFSPIVLGMCVAAVLIGFIRVIDSIPPLD